jgi:hypothetical protein
MESYILGILWGCATYEPTEHMFLVRHRDPFYSQIVAQYFQTNARPHLAQSRTGDQHRLKLRERYCLAELLERGWTERNAVGRPYPAGNIDHAGFCRAWIETHGELDWWHGKRHEGPRLRIYGNRALIADMNGVIAAGTGVMPKTVQVANRRVNEKTCAIYYQSGKEIEAIVGWMYGRDELFNLERKEELMKLLKK